MGLVKPDLHFVEDINQKNKFFIRRSTNPIDPEYNVSSVSGRRVYQIGSITKNKPFGI